MSKEKPRLRNVRFLIVSESIPMKRGLQASFQRSEELSIVADMDAQIISIKPKGAPTICIPFSMAKYWNPDMGVAKE